MATSAGLRAEPASPAKSQAPSVARGKQIYETNCVACHGALGDGRGPASVAIPVKKPRNFIEGKFQYGSTDADLSKTIHDGVPGTSMPSWKSLPDSDIASVVKYIRTFKKP